MAESTGRGSVSDRAQSESIGVILLTAVIVLLVGGFGVVYLGVVDDRASGDGPLVDADVNATADRVAITHAGGESLSIDDLDVIVRGEGSEERFPLDRANTSRSGDGTFDPGDRFARSHGEGGGQLEVLLVDASSNTVVHHAYLDTQD